MEKRWKDIEQAQSMLLKNTIAGELDLSTWRCRPNKTDTMEGVEPIMLDSKTHVHGAAGSKAEHFKSQRRIDADGLPLLCKDWSLDVYHKYLSYIREDVDCQVVKGTALSIARLDAWIATVVKCFSENEARGGNRQKEYADLLAVHFRWASNQIIGEVGDVIAWRASEKLEFYEEEVNVDENMVVRFSNIY